MPHKQWKKDEQRELSDSYILCIKFKGHRTWRIAGNNKRLVSLELLMRDYGDKIESFKLHKMSGVTGEITEFTI